MAQHLHLIVKQRPYRAVQQQHKELRNTSVSPTGIQEHDKDTVKFESQTVRYTCWSLETEIRMCILLRFQWSAVLLSCCTWVYTIFYFMAVAFTVSQSAGLVGWVYALVCSKHFGGFGFISIVLWQVTHILKLMQLFFSGNAFFEASHHIKLPIVVNSNMS